MNKKEALLLTWFLVLLSVAPFLPYISAEQSRPKETQSGNTYEWDGGGDGRNWTDQLNWNLDSGYPDDENDTAIFASTSDDVLTPSIPVTVGRVELRRTFLGEISLQGVLEISSTGDENGSFLQGGGIFNANGHDILVEGDWLLLNGSFLHGNSTVSFLGRRLQNVSSPDALYSIVADGRGTKLVLGSDIAVCQIEIGEKASLEIDAITLGNPRAYLNFTDEPGCGFTTTTSGYINLTGDASHRPTITSANDGQTVTNGWRGRTNAKWRADYAIFRYMRDIRMLSLSTVDVDFSSFNLSKSGTCYAQETPNTFSFTNNSFGSSSCQFYSSAFHASYDNITKEGGGGITVFGSWGISEFFNSDISFDLNFFTGNVLLTSRDGFGVADTFDLATGDGVHYLSEIVYYPPQRSDNITIHGGSLVVDTDFSFRNLFVGHTNSEAINLTVLPGVAVTVGESIRFQNGFGASTFNLIGNETDRIVLRSEIDGQQSSFWLNTPRYFAAEYVDFKDLLFSEKMAYASNSRDLGNCENLCIDCVLWYREETPSVMDDRTGATFEVSYYSPTNTPPSFMGMAANIDGQWHTYGMKELKSEDMTYSDTKDYVLSLPLDTGPYAYYFVGDNGTVNETTPAYPIRVVTVVDGHYRLANYNANRSHLYRDIVHYREAGFLSTIVVQSPDGYAYTTIGGPNVFRVYQNDSVELVHSFLGWSGTNGLTLTDDGIMFISLRNTSAPFNSSLFRSEDYGSTWTRLGPWNVQENFGFDVDDKGNYYFANYSQRMFGQKAANISIYKSSDKGLTWRSMLNVTTPVADHMHIVRVDPYVPGSIWATHGDDPPGNGLWHSSDYGRTWEFLHYEQHTGAVFNERYVFFGQDNTPYAMRVYDKTQDVTFYTHTLPDEGWQAWTAIEYTWHMTTINGIFWQILTDYAGGKEDGLWASWDGFHWVMVDHFGGAFPRGITYAYDRLYLSFNEGSNTRIYDMMSKQDIMELYYAVHQTDPIPSYNGTFSTGHVLQSLSHHVIGNPQIRFKSHPIKQFFTHPDMEQWSYGCQQNTGPCGWSTAQTGVGNVSWARDYDVYHSPPSSSRIVNTNAQEAYYVMHSHPLSFGEYLKPRQYYTFSFWVKANRTYHKGLCWEVHWVDLAGTDIGTANMWCTESLTTNWTRFSGQYFSITNTRRVQIWWYVLGKYITVWTDDWSWVEGINTSAFLVEPHPEFSNGTANTGNISYLQIGTNELAYSEPDGILSNSSYTAWIPLIDRIGGFADFGASVERSGIADYQIAGDTVLFVENGYVMDYNSTVDKAIIRMFRGDIYIGEKIRIAYARYDAMDVLLDPEYPFLVNFTNWSDQLVTIEYNSSVVNNVSFLIGRLLPFQNYSIEIGALTDYAVTDENGYLSYNFSGSGKRTILIKSGPEPPILLGVQLTGQNLENVTLRWDPSSDEPGEYNITEYRVYRTNASYDRQLTGYQLVAVLSRDAREYSDVGAGVGEVEDFFYSVCAVTNTGISACTVLQGGKLYYQLGPGFRLISIPLAQYDSSTEKVLQTVEFEKAWAYDSLNQKWLWYMKSKTYLGALQDVDVPIGLWLEVIADSDYFVAGVVPFNATINLKAGWNLIGVPSFLVNITVLQLKTEASAIKVEGFSASSPPSYLRVLADAEVLSPGKGYWVFVTQDVSWSICNF